MNQEKLIIVMVGLPARGKSYITKKIANYLHWLNIETRIFNVGNKRRQTCEDEQNADFFDPNDSQYVKIRDELALESLDEVLEYLSGEGQVGIFDATNSTIRRRRMVIDHISKRCQQEGLMKEYNVLFLESICNNQTVIDQNILLKLNGPDYKEHENKRAALADFKKRLENYESVYQTVRSSEFTSEPNCQYLKIVDIYSLRAFNIQGFLPIMLHNFLKHFSIKEKKIWVSLDHIGFEDLEPVIHSKEVTVVNSSAKADKIIPTSLSLDQIHDLILELEVSQKDILIQTQDDMLINGLLKYFQILDDCHPDLTTQVLCILPHHYSVGLQKFDVHEIPQMTRSNSAISNASSVMTPREELDWTMFNYQNLNLAELSSKLERLK